MSGKIKVIIADDHAIVRAGFSQIIGNAADMEIVGVAENGIQIFNILSRLQADKAYLQKMIVSFNQATERAEASVNRLRAAAIEANDALQTNTKVAKELRSDLSFLIDRAELFRQKTRH